MNRADGSRLVLIVDDDDDIRTALSLVLESEGYETMTAADGVEALQRLQSLGNSPLLVLLDLMMPRMSGVELLQELRGDPGLAHIPVVVFSGDIQARRTVSALGVEYCLAKPLDADQLVKMVDRLARGG